MEPRVQDLRRLSYRTQRYYWGTYLRPLNAFDLAAILANQNNPPSPPASDTEHNMIIVRTIEEFDLIGDARNHQDKIHRDFHNSHSLVMCMMAMRGRRPDECDYTPMFKRWMVISAFTATPGKLNRWETLRLNLAYWRLKFQAQLAYFTGIKIAFDKIYNPTPQLLTTKHQPGVVITEHQPTNEHPGVVQATVTTGTTMQDAVAKRPTPEQAAEAA